MLVQRIGWQQYGSSSNYCIAGLCGMIGWDTKTIRISWKKKRFRKSTHYTKSKRRAWKLSSDPRHSDPPSKRNLFLTLNYLITQPRRCWGNITTNHKDNQKAKNQLFYRKAHCEPAVTGKENYKMSNASANSKLQRDMRVMSCVRAFPWPRSPRHTVSRYREHTLGHGYNRSKQTWPKRNRKKEFAASAGIQAQTTFRISLHIHIFISAPPSLPQTI